MSYHRGDKPHGVARSHRFGRNKYTYPKDHSWKPAWKTAPGRPRGLVYDAEGRQSRRVSP